MAKSVNMLGGNGGSKSGAVEIGREQASLDAGFIYKSARQLHGANLFTYTVACLGMLKAFTGQAFKAAALSGMFGSDTVISHHKRQGNLEADGRGMVRLTAKGKAYFGGRELGLINGQKVDAKEVSMVATAIRAGAGTSVTKDSQTVRAISWRRTGSTS